MDSIVNKTGRFSDPPLAHDVSLEQYSGPLDMLLQLIRKQEMDILQIDIHKITGQYVERLKNIPKPDLERAGDFIRMAAVLMYIKSKTLLQEEDSENSGAEEEEAPLKERLIQLLLNCQKFQTAGRLLYQRNLLGRDTWVSPYRAPLPASRSEDLLIDREKAPFLLIQRYNKILSLQKGRRPHAPAPPLPSLMDRAREIASALIKGAKLKFSQLAKMKKSPHSSLLTFLSLLELCRLGFASLRQKSPFGELDINMKKTFDSKNFFLLDEESPIKQIQSKQRQGEES